MKSTFQILERLRHPEYNEPPPTTCIDLSPEQLTLDGSLVILVERTFLSFVAAVMIAVACSTTAWGHPLPANELDRLTLVRIAPDRVVVEYSILLTAEAWFLEQSLMNADGTA